MSKIICIGLPKTGTKSLTLALRALGFNTQHNPHYIRRSLQLERAEAWDVPTAPFTAGVDAVTNVLEWDFPRYDKYYPGAKFICTTRDFEGWLTSCHRHFAAPPKNTAMSIVRCSVLGSDTFNCNRFTTTYIAHAQHVASYFADRPADLLTLPLCNQAAYANWRALTAFLGVEYDLTQPFPAVKAPF